MSSDLPSSPASERAPAANPRFSLRSLLLLTAIVAIVAAVCRHSLLATLAVGMPIVLYTIFSYVLHRQRSSGWICLAISIFASSFGFFAYSFYAEAPGFILGASSFDITNLAFAGRLSFLFGFFFGFIPLILEYWLWVIIDSLIFLARTATKLASRQSPR